MDSTTPSAAAPVPTLIGTRVRLRALGADDADALYALHSDPRVMRYWSHPAWTRREQAVERIEWLARDHEQSGSCTWAATTLESDALIGTASLFALNRTHARAEIGYALASALWRRGLATAMLELVVDHAFGPLGLERLEADIDPRNEASCRLVERVGFRREGLLRARWRVAGEVTDSAWYGLLRSDRREDSRPENR